jgi:hypothetical protein
MKLLFVVISSIFWRALLVGISCIFLVLSEGAVCLMSVNSDRGSPNPHYLLNFGLFIRGVFQEPKLVLSFGQRLLYQ